MNSNRVVRAASYVKSRVNCSQASTLASWDFSVSALANFSAGAVFVTLTFNTYFLEWKR